MTSRTTTRVLRCLVIVMTIATAVHALALWTVVAGIAGIAYALGGWPARYDKTTS